MHWFNLFSSISAYIYLFSSRVNSFIILFYSSHNFCTDIKTCIKCNLYYAFKHFKLNKKKKKKRNVECNHQSNLIIIFIGVCILGFAAVEWGSNTIEVVSQYTLTQVNCEILDKLTSDSYMISCETIRTWVDAHSSWTESSKFCNIHKS